MSLPTPEALIEQARQARRQAYAPYSRYAVGAALLAEDGRVFTGCNVENASYGLTSCAERNAVFAAVLAGCRSFTAVALVAEGEEPPYPCGACRQVLAEFMNKDAMIHVASASDTTQIETVRLGELLPKTFSFDPDPEKTSHE